MTAKLPPLQWPLQIAIVGFSEAELEAIRKWADDRALQAVRDALERVRVAVKESKENAFQQSADEAICALLKEYGDE